MEFLFHKIFMNCNEDAKVIETNTEAGISKSSCVSVGYYDDRFIRLMVSSSLRRNPIINLGYAIRVATFRNLVSSFVAVYPTSQIVSLGAGLDTLGFWIVEKFPNVNVFELDYPSVVSEKSKRIQKHSAVLQDISSSLERLHLIQCDLRSIPGGLAETLQQNGFNATEPTLFLVECVLVYLERSINDSITETIASSVTNRSTPVYFASYDQVNPHDAFGRIMMTNLAERGCPLRSIEQDVDSQKSRLARLGFPRVRVEHMSYFTTRCQTKRPEIIDEVEELNLLQNHYMFTLASTEQQADADIVFKKVFFEES